MYKIRITYRNKENNKRFNELLKNNNKKQKEIAEQIGVNKAYISQVANGKNISKLCAYAICKAISPELEINDLFRQIKK